MELDDKVMTNSSYIEEENVQHAENIELLATSNVVNYSSFDAEENTRLKRAAEDASYSSSSNNSDSSLSSMFHRRPYPGQKNANTTTPDAFQERVIFL